MLFSILIKIALIQLLSTNIYIKNIGYDKF